jgi:hypothetical protein
MRCSVLGPPRVISFRDIEAALFPEKSIGS